MSTEQPRPSRLWRDMTDTQQLAASQAFWADEGSYAEQAEVMGLIARQLKFRPKSVVALPVEKKVRLTLRMGAMSDAVAGRLLVSYHLGTQRLMMSAFLDALGIKHGEGLIDEDETPAPTPEQIDTAVAAVLPKFPVDDVRLYFQTLLLQDPDTWGRLAQHVPAPPAA
ncbi:MAG: hypothetical protein JNM38_18585 [Acidobacteria bacterium]|jgi:hypothetical protein|nr:hypothetical protein [Acidobacteriota bacterium]